MKQKVRFPLAPIALVVLMLTTLTTGITQVVNIVQYGRWAYTFPWWNLTVSVLFTLGMLLLLVGTCVLLLIKNRSVILPVVLCGYVLYFLAAVFKILLFIRQGYNYNSSMDVRSLILLYSYSFLVFFVFTLVDQKLIKKDMTNLKALVTKAFYLPALVCAAGWIIYGAYDLIILITRSSFTFLKVINICVDGLDWIATIAFMFLLMMWLKDPFVKEKTASSAPTEDSGDASFSLPVKETPVLCETPEPQETPVLSGTPEAPQITEPCQSPEPAVIDETVLQQIRKYQAFLDAGLISQQDFDRKKQQLLGS